MRARFPFLLVPLLLGVAALTALAAVLPAQTLKNERRLHAWACSLENELLRRCLHLPEKRRAEIARVLAAADGNDPLRDLGRALAVAAGDKADDELLFRRGLMLFALPEVVDPVGAPDNERIPDIDAVTLTVWAPRTMTVPGKARFALRIKDAADKTVWSGEIRKDTGIYGLRTFLAHKSIPVEDFPDGLYRVEADILLDGRRPRARDPGLGVSFWVLRGFVKRRLDLFEEGRRLQPDLDPLSWALLAGTDRVVHRFFSGEPGADTTACLRELAHAERVLDNLRENRKRKEDDKDNKEKKDKKVPPLDGISGWVSVELPNQDMWQVEVALRRMPPGPRDQPDQLPPLVLFVPGAPAWNPRGRRPRSPESLAPGFLVEMLETSGFDRHRRWQLAVVESPGRVRRTLPSLRNVLAALEELADIDKALRFDRSKVFLVGDRQGASAVVGLALDHPKRFRALVLASGGVGALTLNNIDKLSELPVLVIPGHGHAATEGILEHYRIARKHGKARHIQVLSGSWPWSIALPLASGKIEAFLAGVLGEPLPAPTSRVTSRPTSRSSR